MGGDNGPVLDAGADQPQGSADCASWRSNIAVPHLAVARTAELVASGATTTTRLASNEGCSRRSWGSIEPVKLCGDGLFFQPGCAKQLGQRHQSMGALAQSKDLRCLPFCSGL